MNCVKKSEVSHQFIEAVSIYYHVSFLVGERREPIYLVVRMARFYNIGTAHTIHVRMRGIFPRKMVQRSPFWPDQIAFKTAHAQVSNTAARVIE